MEITKDDLKNLKLAPTLILFIKCVHFKDKELLQELALVSNIANLAKHLEEKMIIKIIDNSISINSFEVRSINVINYLDSNSRNVENEVDEVINYFKSKTGKVRTSNKSEANRRFIRARLKEYSVQDLTDVIDVKFEQWRRDPSMKGYIRIATLFNDEKFQGYIGEVESNDTKSRTVTG